ncbi:MAG: tRNA dihydrouridine(20/20a) synthase DusA [Alphaproteobacteria bacterium]|nr:tRNA dihydrouridine(20/20a) synthase DusA [Alphaproteobacteria bacterium]
MNQVNKTYKVQKPLSKISVAPMLDWTNKHCRAFHRLISPNTLLYTEMVTTGALIHGDWKRYLRYNQEQHPIALQLGGSDPQDLATCSKMAEDHGYDEINLNCGCPSDRVQKGQFGAVLMESPDLVARCIESMCNATTLPITVKCRIGIDKQDSFAFLDKFISTSKQAGCAHYIIHARKAWLNGLSPKENRTVPPINYERAAEIKAKHPELSITINGEIKTTEQAIEHLKIFDSVMIGREAYKNPYILNEVETKIFKTPEKQCLSRIEIAHAMIPYIEKQMHDFGTPAKSITRHIMGLFQEQRGARKWRQTLSTLPYEESITPAQIIEKALTELTATIASC